MKWNPLMPSCDLQQWRRNTKREEAEQIATGMNEEEKPWATWLTVGRWIKLKESDTRRTRDDSMKLDRMVENWTAK